MWLKFLKNFKNVKNFENPQNAENVENAEFRRDLDGYLILVIFDFEKWLFSELSE